MSGKWEKTNDRSFIKGLYYYCMFCLIYKELFCKVYGLSFDFRNGMKNLIFQKLKNGVCKIGVWSIIDCVKEPFSVWFLYL